MYSNNHAAHIGRDASNITVVSYNPAVVFFSLFALCLLIMSPMLWILWLIRKDSQEERDLEQQRHRISSSTKVPPRKQPTTIIEQTQQQDDIVENMPNGREQEPVQKKTRMTALASKVRDLADTSRRITTTQSLGLYDNIRRSFTKMAPSSRQSHHRTGVSIDLPIMKQPAWQQLATGGLSPSTTFGDFIKHAKGEKRNGSTQTELEIEGLGQQGEPHGGVVEPQKPQPAMTIGLAIS